MTILLQWLWQGSAIAVTLLIALRAAPRINAATRYALWWVALIVVLLLPFLPHLTTSGHASIASTRFGTAMLAPDTSPSTRPLVAVPAPPDWAIACGIGAWLGSVLLGFGRLRRGLVTIRQLKRLSRPVAVSVERSLSLRQQWRRAGRRHATLRVSSSVSGACALGLLGRPVIVLSDRLLTTLGPDDLDLIILHEQVHLARYDDWATLLQSGVNVLVGWHPAVRVITAALDAEREAACDDAVAARIGNPARYATCLADAADVIAARRISRAQAMAPQAAGTGSLLVRVQRLLDPRVRQRAVLQRVALGSGIAGLALASLGAIALGPVVGSEAPESTGARSILDAMPTPSPDVSNAVHSAVHSTDARHMSAFEPVVIVDRIPSIPAPVEASKWSARGARARARVIRSSEQPLSRGTALTQVASTESRRDATDSGVAPGAVFAANAAVGEPTPPPIQGRFLAGKPVVLADSPPPVTAGAVTSAAVDAESSVWTVAGRRVAREHATVGQRLAQRSTALGQQLARRSGALGGFFGRAGKAVAGQF